LSLLQDERASDDNADEGLETRAFVDRRRDLEYRFVTGREILRQIGDVRIAPPSVVPRRGRLEKDG
jgi:hypothetical protein